MIFLDGVAKNKELSANSQSIGSWELKYGVRRPDMPNKGRLVWLFTSRLVQCRIRLSEWQAFSHLRITKVLVRSSIYHRHIVLCIKTSIFQEYAGGQPPFARFFRRHAWNIQPVLKLALALHFHPQFSETNEANVYQVISSDRPMYIKWQTFCDTVSSPSDEKIILNHSIFAYNSLQASR